jgi:hypothetical protein
MLSHNVECDKNVTDLINKKIVEAELNGEKVLLENVEYISEYDDNVSNEKIYINYGFEGVNDKFYYVQYYDGKIYLNGSEANVTLSNIEVKEPTTALDVPGDIKISANALTNNTTLTVNLSAKSNGDGKTYSIFASDINITNQNNFISLQKVEVDMEHNKAKEYPYFTNFVTTWDELYEEDEDKTTKVLLENLNATIYDKNNNPLILSGVNVLADLTNKNGNIYGTFKYLDAQMTGFVSYADNNITKDYSLYLDIQRDGYAPFTLGAIAKNEPFNANKTTTTSVIKKGDYLLYVSGYTEEVDGWTSEYKGYDSNGVFLEVKKFDGNTTVKITDKDGKELATFDPKTKTITYSDGTTETLY